MTKFATHIADQQYARLKALAARRGITQAELLRRFLEEGLARMEEEIQRKTQTSGSRATSEALQA